jgi:hypothetical protein
MKPWTIWMMQHRLTWLLKIIVVLAFVPHWFYYAKVAWYDISVVLRNINYYKTKQNEITD